MARTRSIRKSLISLEFVLHDARFWIILLFAIRLFHIDQPPMHEHTWRQSLTLGVARNYIEWDANFFHPRTPLCDSRTGIIAQEFPIYNYVIAIGWWIFGEQDWIWRLLNIIVVSLGLYWFYHLVRRMLNHRAAIAGMVILGCSVMFTYSRKAMPDTLAISLAVGAVWYGWKYLTAEYPKRKDLIMFVVLATIGMLIKIPAAAVMTLLIPAALSSQTPMKRKVVFGAVSAIPLAMVGAWYFAWVPWAEATYGFKLYYPRELSVGFQELMDAGYHTYERFEILALKSKVTFYMCVLGLVLLFLQWRQKKLMLTWLAYSAVFFYFMVKAGNVFSSHEYYVMPYNPMLAILGGYFVHEALTRKQGFLAGMLIVIATLQLTPQWDSFFLWPEERKYHRLEEICDKYIPKDAKILTSTYDHNPMMMYFCHRRGWTDNDNWKNEEWIASEATVGMEYVVVERFRHDTALSFPLIYEDEDFLIYKTIPAR